MNDVTVIDNCVRSGCLPARPSKSVLHRRVLAAALTNGLTLLDLEGFALSRDNQLTLDAVSGLGLAHVERQGNKIELVGGMSQPGVIRGVDCGESGSTLRFLIPIVLLTVHGARLTGAPQLFQRPLEPYLQLFQQRGAVTRLTADGLLLGGNLYAGRYELPGNISSQYATGLLLTLPLLAEDSQLVFDCPPSSRGYIDLTLEVLATCGVQAAFSDPCCIQIPGGQRFRPCSAPLERDYSHAAFFLAAGALSGPVTVEGLAPNSSQGDRRLLAILQQYGAKVTVGDTSVTVSAGERRPLRLDVDQIPDLAPVLAMLAAAAEGESRFSNAGRLRYKESDRLQVLTEVLTRLGAPSYQRNDTLVVQGSRQLLGGYVDHFNDHRIAMALAAVSGVCRTPLVLMDGGVTEKSAPEFWQQFDSLRCNNHADLG